MAITKKNFLKYSSLTYSEIINQINSKLKADKRFDSFRESAIAQIMVEIFAGCADLVNYYIDRRSEECYFDTARLKSSIILLARQLGYVMKRQVPAEANIKIEIEGPLGAGVDAGDKIQIPYHRVFTYGGNSFVIKDGFTYTLTTADMTTLDAGGTVTLTQDDYGNNVAIVQGEIKEKIIEGATNSQVGQKFQIYRINDKDFSNRYGDEDYTIPVTRVWVGNTKTDDTEFSIDRRSLINWESIENFQAGTGNKVCLIRTSTDESVELLFGDAMFASIGANISAADAPETSFDNVYIQYLSTKGDEANQTGIIENKLTFADKVVVDSVDITSSVTFKFITNLTGGAKAEDIDSIRLNAPEIYYSLDRLVSKRDYVAYLKSLTSPIDIKDAVAWGEQEEIDKRKTTAIMDMFNTVFFSCVGSLYNLDGDEDSETYTPRTKEDNLYKSVLDIDYDEYKYTDQSFYNVYVKNFSGADIARQIKNYEEVDTSAAYKIIRGGEMEDDPIIVVTSAYGTSAVMNVTYSTTRSNNHPGVVGITSAAVNLQSLTSYDDLASRIQSVIRAIDDERPSCLGTSGLSGVYVEYDSTNRQFSISGSSTDSLYVSAINDIEDDGLFTNLKIITSEWTEDKFAYEGTGETRIISKGIKDLVDDLKTRSQVTVRNVYITPTIQTMNITGTVYLKQLEDKEDMQRQINNAIYKWADQNIDFNTPIYISNIVEVIENFPSVLNANIKLEPDAPQFNPSDYGLPSWRTSYWPASLDDRLTSQEYTSFAGGLASYLSASSETQYTETITSAYLSTYEYYSKNLEFLKNINERTFYETFVKNVYHEMRSYSDGIIFRDTETFKEVVSDIRKDLLWLIKYNMIDENGNIAQQVDSSDLPVRGGYSLGTEIVKLNSLISYEYR